MKTDAYQRVEMIPIKEIRVLNPRFRNKQKFQQIVSNIKHIGFKQPITVSRSHADNGDRRYDLVCGQGRLEAFVALEQERI